MILVVHRRIILAVNYMFCSFFPFVLYRSANRHCVKSVRIRSYTGLHFPAFELNTERYSVSLRSQSKCGKTKTRIIPYMDTFFAVRMWDLVWQSKTHLEDSQWHFIGQVIKHQEYHPFIFFHVFFFLCDQKVLRIVSLT